MVILSVVLLVLIILLPILFTHLRRRVRLVPSSNPSRMQSCSQSTMVINNKPENLSTRATTSSILTLERERIDASSQLNAEDVAATNASDPVPANPTHVLPPAVIRSCTGTNTSGVDHLLPSLGELLRGGGPQLSAPRFVNTEVMLAAEAAASNRALWIGSYTQQQMCDGTVSSPSKLPAIAPLVASASHIAPVCTPLEQLELRRPSRLLSIDRGESLCRNTCAGSVCGGGSVLGDATVDASESACKNIVTSRCNAISAAAVASSALKSSRAKVVQNLQLRSRSRDGPRALWVLAAQRSDDAAALDKAQRALVKVLGHMQASPPSRCTIQLVPRVSLLALSD